MKLSYIVRSHIYEKSLPIHPLILLLPQVFGDLFCLFGDIGISLSCCLVVDDPVERVERGFNSGGIEQYRNVFRKESVHEIIQAGQKMKMIVVGDQKLRLAAVDVEIPHIVGLINRQMEYAYGKFDKA